MKKKLFLSLVSLSFLCSCSAVTSGKWFNYVAPTNIKTTTNATVQPFNTSMQLSYFVYDNQNYDELTKKVSEFYQKEVVRLHQLFDTHYKYYADEENKKVYNNLYVINANYGTKKAIPVDKDVYHLLKDSIYYTELTNGYFNIFSGKISDYWNPILKACFDWYPEIEVKDPLFSSTQKEKLNKLVAAMPSLEESKDLLTFDDKNYTITFNELPNVSYNGEILDRSMNGDYKPKITVGGVAKGYATNILRNEFIQKKYNSAYFSSGGSSLTTVSDPIYDEADKGQFLNILDPRSAYNLLNKKYCISFNIAQKFSISTSGNYTNEKSYQFMQDDEIIYRHHIVNPFTGYPSSYHRSVTLVSYTLDAGILDALSTAFVSMNLEDGLIFRKKLLNDFGKNYDLSLIYVDQTGSDEDGTLTITSTSDFNQTLKINDSILGVTIQYAK